MAVYTLPIDFFPAAPIPVVVQYNYKSSKAIHTNQVQLTHHLISFLQKGQKTVLLPQKTVVVPPNHFLLLSEGHCLMSETLSPQQYYHSHLLFFKQQIVHNLLLKHQIEVPNTTVACNFQILAYDGFVRNFIQSLQFIPKADTAFLQHKVEEFLLYGYHQYGASFFSFLKTPPIPSLQQIAQVAQKAIYEKLTLEQMAFLCAMSLSTFKRRFASYYNTTPQSWLREQRLQRAAQLLRQGHYRPSELSEKLGFQHHSSFTAAFKSRFGMPPSAYLNQS
ncbi:MAG: helix-turn-helix transcriptional regulator [Aureispira sp.]